MNHLEEISAIKVSGNGNHRSVMKPLYAENKELEGWGRSNRANSDVAHPTDQHQLQGSIHHTYDRTILARGEGRSYGDASLNGGNITLQMEKFDYVIEFDRERGIFTCEGGMTLKAILETVVLQAGFYQ